MHVKKVDFYKKPCVIVPLVPLIVGCILLVIIIHVASKLYVHPSCVEWQKHGTHNKDELRAMWYSYMFHYNDNHATGLNDTNTISNNDKVISCYYNMPKNLADPVGNLLPSDIDPHLCTHINVAFARVHHGVIDLPPDSVTVLDALRTHLNSANPKLKILISVGGSDEGYPNMVKNHANRKVFIKSVIEFLVKHKLNGVDLDWEFPAMNGMLRERQHFSQLLRELRVEFTRGNHDFVLTVAAGAPELLIEQSYDVDQLNLYTDYVNIMTYDYHYFTSYTPFTGLNAPLYSHETIGYVARLNINYTIDLYMRKGLDANKIVVGIPTYGHTYELYNKDNTNIGSPAKSYGDLGTVGFINYPDICEYIKNHEDKVVLKMDAVGKVPYLSNGFTWVSYENEYSVMEKAKLVKKYNLRGAMIYSLNADDYLGKCLVQGIDNFPLAHAVSSTLLEGEIQTSQN